MLRKTSTVQELQTNFYQVIDGLFSTIESQEDRIASLEVVINAVKEAQTNDKIYNVREAAEKLRIRPDSVRKDRLKGRLKGFKTNEKEWGFLQSEIERYLKRYERPVL